MSPRNDEADTAISTEPLISASSDDTNRADIVGYKKLIRLIPRLTQIIGAILVMIPNTPTDRLFYNTTERALLIIGPLLLLFAQCPPHSLLVFAGHANLSVAFLGYMYHDFSVGNLQWGDSVLLFSGILLFFGNIFSYAGVVRNMKEERFFSAVAKGIEVIMSLVLMGVAVMGLVEHGTGKFDFYAFKDAFFVAGLGYIFAAILHGIGDIYDPDRVYFPIYGESSIHINDMI